MNKFQADLFKIFKEFNQKPEWFTYPPYHSGLYLEDYFIKYFYENNINTKSYFIPIPWSVCYLNKNINLLKLQDLLNNLPKDEKYFTVSTHDDAPWQILPKNTTTYSAGGNKGHVAIPLVVSKIPNNFLINKYDKNYLASFIGSITHPLRDKLINKFGNNNKFFFQSKAWSPDVKNDSFLTFLQKSFESNYGLAPRGYGKTSYRLYELMQLSVVPVYLSDDFWLPWSDEIDWDSLIIKCNPSEIDYLDLILQDDFYSEKFLEKINNINKIYDNFFTIESVTKKIIMKENK